MEREIQTFLPFSYAFVAINFFVRCSDGHMLSSFKCAKVHEDFEK
jgi:hypothetical protein